MIFTLLIPSPIKVTVNVLSYLINIAVESLDWALLTFSSDFFYIFHPSPSTLRRHCGVAINILNVHPFLEAFSFPLKEKSPFDGGSVAALVAFDELSSK